MGRSSSLWISRTQVRETQIQPTPLFELLMTADPSVLCCHDFVVRPGASSEILKTRVGPLSGQANI